jgi:LmbE family N-acetylglucosaminyl deacetylase
MKRVLAFSCHPDDAEFMASGTLALLADRGHEIHMATVTGGEVGSVELDHQQIREKRLAEAATSAAVLGGRYHYAGGFDLEVEYNSFHRKAVTRVIREVDPAIILTVPPVDYLPDHEETSKLVRNGAFIASVTSFDCGTVTKPMESIPYLYYWSGMGLRDNFGRPLAMHFGVDVSTKMEIKEKMLAAHASQREWLRHINKWDAYIENMKDETRRQGKLIGREYGECFLQHVGNGHPQDNILKEILGDLAVDLSPPEILL